MTPGLQERFSRRSYALFNGSYARGMTPRPKRSPSVWAEKERWMPIGGPVSGTSIARYDHNFAPHAIEPMDAADDESVRMIVLWFAIRESKTNGVCMNIIGRMVTDDPGGIYSVHPSDDDIQKFSTDDMEPLIEHCPSVKPLFVAKKSRETGRTTSFKKYAGGSVRIVPYSSPTKYRGSTVKGLFMHEVDALTDTKLLPYKESVYKAIGRTTGIPDAVVVMESTCTLAPTQDEDGKTVYRSVIHEHYEKGDMRKWFCACQSCGHLQVIRYSHFRFPPGEMAKTLCHCEACDYGHNEKEWRKMAAEGRWYATAGLTAEELQDIETNHLKAKPKQPEVRSYWRNGFTSLLPKSKGYATKLHQFVAEGEAAKGSKEALKTWTNEIVAELWDDQPEGEALADWKSIFDRREDYGLIVPAGGLFLTAFIDVHKNRLEVSWKAWGRKEESWAMDHRVLRGFVGDHDPQSSMWQDLRRELARKFRHALGCDIALGLAFVDGGWHGDDAYIFFQDLAKNPEPGVYGKVFATKGEGDGAIISRRMKTVDNRLKGYAVGTWRAKRVVTDRLRMQPPEGWESRLARGESIWGDDKREGLPHFNKQFSEEYIQQMCRERPKIHWEKGREVEKWENPGKQRNEGLDLEVGNLAAVRFHFQPWDLLEADLKERAARIAAGPTLMKEPPKERRRSSFVSDWR